MIALAQLWLTRLFKSPRAWASAAFWMLVAVGIAGYVERNGGGHGVDEVLPGVFGSYALPLIVFSLVGGVVAATSLRASIRPAIALGATGSRSAISAILVVALVSAVVCGALGAALVPLSGAPRPFGADVLASAWVSALGAAAYASFFAFGASFGKNGGGRTLFLVYDLVFGSTGGIVEVATPSAHLRNLLGGAPIKHVSQTASAVTLGVLAVVCLLLSARRAR